MNPTATRVAMAVKAATRGTLNRKLAIRAAGATNVRYLTLPPGSVRGFPFREQAFYEGYLSDRDDEDALEIESRPKTMISMSPRVRRFGTSLDTPDLNGTAFSAVHHQPRLSSFDEDYDEWSLHCKPSSSTKSDLGDLSDYDPAVQSLLHTSTLGESSAEYSSPFENIVDDE